MKYLIWKVRKINGWLTMYAIYRIIFFLKMDSAHKSFCSINILCIPVASFELFQKLECVPTLSVQVWKYSKSKFTWWCKIKLFKLHVTQTNSRLADFHVYQGHVMHLSFIWEISQRKFSKLEAVFSLFLIFWGNPSALRFYSLQLSVLSWFKPRP